MFDKNTCEWFIVAEVSFAQQGRSLDDATRTLAHRSEELERYKGEVGVLKSQVRAHVQRSEYIPRDFTVDARVRVAGTLWCLIR